MCFRINLTKPDSVRQPVTFRKLRDIFIPEFIKYLTTILTTLNELNELVHAYTTEIEAVVDQHAPVQRKSITLRPNAQWYSDEPRQAKRARREGVAANQTYGSSTAVQGAMQRIQLTDDQCQENIIFCKNQRLRQRSETTVQINVSFDE